MTAATQSLTKITTSNPQIRPIKLPQDLGAVADLIELCFEDTLDADGRRFIRQMRRAASSRGKSLGFSSFPRTIKGFVWVEEDSIVGNINLIPVAAQSRKAYLLANVSVHPDFRRRGIAHTLTEACLAFAEQRGVRHIWLQVDENNLGAQQLYTGFGFRERARRTLWHSQPGQTRLKVPPSMQVRPRQRGDWRQQKQWLDNLYGSEVRWNLPLDLKPLYPGVGGVLLRALNERSFRQWTATYHGQWIGSLTWQTSHSQADWLWLAASPEKRELAICALIPHAGEELLAEGVLSPSRTLAINFPAEENTAAFETIGFHEHQTLIWMEKSPG